MHGDMRDRLKTEITRKQFLQYSAGALLMVFGLNNLISLLTGNRTIEKTILMPGPGNDHDGFGSRRFGT